MPPPPMPPPAYMGRGDGQEMGMNGGADGPPPLARRGTSVRYA